MTYTATFKVMGKQYSSQGKTKEECLENLNVPHNFARGVGILSLSKKENDKELTEERVLPQVLAQRIFSQSPNVRKVHLKQVGLRFSL